MVQVGVESEDGWRPAKAGPDILEWVIVPGTNPPVRLQLMKGWPSTVMKAYAADYNAFVERLRDADSAGFTPTNSVATSNHLNGTAMDLNWNDHPFHVSYGGYTPDMIATMRDILAFYEDTMFWAQDWDDPKDCMHHQMSYNTWNNSRVQDFIDRKIRPDGFSTFRRGDASPTPAVDRVAVLADAMGNRDGVDYASKLAAVTQCLNECGCTTVDRIAMWMGQVGEESGGLQWMEEIASGAEYEGRDDLGNNQPGDGRRFKGRGPIQVTGRHNYTVLSQWAYSQGLVPSPTFFVDNPDQLASDQYGFIGVTWYWTTQRPMNDAADARDIVRATKYVNGGTNGLQDRTDRWNHCLSMGDRLLALLNQGDDDEMGAVDGPSVSIYRTDDNSIGVCNPVTRANNAMLHEAHVEALAEAGLPWEAGLLAALEAGHLPASNQPGAADRARFLLDHKVPADVAAAARKAAAS